MSDNDLKVIVKAKELATHTFKLTSNCNRYPKKYLKMAKLVEAGKLPREKFDISFNAWKNHISHGNCYKLLQTFEHKITTIYQSGDWKLVKVEKK